MITFLVAMLFSWSVHAEVGRNVVVKGRITAVDAKTATLKNDSGTVSVPAQRIDPHNAKGDWVSVEVDIVEFLRLNRERIEGTN